MERFCHYLIRVTLGITAATLLILLVLILIWVI